MRLLAWGAGCLVASLAWGVVQLQKHPVLLEGVFALPVWRERERPAVPSGLFQEARAVALLALLAERHPGYGLLAPATPQERRPPDSASAVHAGTRAWPDR